MFTELVHREVNRRVAVRFEPVDNRLTFTTATLAYRYCTIGVRSRT